jgi:hypothetical protein
MASSNDNPDDPELVDLLYDDELDDQTAADLRSQLQASSPEDAAELEAYEQMLGRARETETDQEVPSDVHDSIVDTARRHARQRTEEAAHPEDSPPTSSGKQRTQTLWGRLSSSSTLARLGTAAAALLACGTILYVMRGELTPPNEPTAETASESSPSAPAEGFGEAPSETYGPPDSADKSKENGTPEPEESSTDSVSEEPSRNALEMIRGDDSDDPSSSGQPSSAKQTDDGIRARRQKPPAPTTGNGDSSARQPKPTEQAEKRAALDNSPAPESKQTDDASADMIEPFGSGTSSDSSKSKTSDDPPSSVASESAAAEPTGKSDRGGESGGSGATPLVDVETAYLNENWAGTIKGVDLLLASEDLEPSDEARALELKARAFEQQDKPGKAHSTFTSLADRFPEYKPSDIESAIERTNRDGEEEPAASDAPDNASGLDVFRGD